MDAESSTVSDRGGAPFTNRARLDVVGELDVRGEEPEVPELLPQVGHFFLGFDLLGKAVELRELPDRFGELRLVLRGPVPASSRARKAISSPASQS